MIFAHPVTYVCASYTPIANVLSVMRKMTSSLLIATIQSSLAMVSTVVMMTMVPTTKITPSMRSGATILERGMCSGKTLECSSH